MSERPKQSEQEQRRTKALRRVAIIRDSLIDDGAELEALKEETASSGGPPSQTQGERADLLRNRVKRRERELAVRRDEYADLQGGGQRDRR